MLIPNVNLPPGKVGQWVIERMIISKADAEFNNVRAVFGGDRPIQPGEYTRLLRGGTTVMSDTPAEKRDHYAPVVQAKGHCLVNGLGIGMVLNAMLLKPEVTKVTVIEISPEVISLVAPHFAHYGERLEIVQSDAFDYRPPRGARYGVVWHDIWDDICADNLEGMKKLHRKYGRHADWQGSWCRAECRRRNRHDW